VSNEPDIIKAVVELLPTADSTDSPAVSFSLPTASANAQATKQRIALQAQPAIEPVPDIEVVFETGTEPDKSAVETIRDANNRVASFLSKQNRLTRGRSAA